MRSNILIFVGILFCTSIGVYLINLIVNNRLKGKIDEKEVPNTLYALKAILFIALSLLVSQMLLPLQTLDKVLPATYAATDLKVNAIMYFSLISSISLLTFAVIWWISTLFFGILSNGRNIYIESLTNNLGLFFLFAGILMAFSISAMPCLSAILDYLIPYPKMPIFR